MSLNNNSIILKDIEFYKGACNKEYQDIVTCLKDAKEDIKVFGVEVCEDKFRKLGDCVINNN